MTKKTTKNLRSPQRRLLKDSSKPLASVGQQPLDFLGEKKPIIVNEKDRQWALEHLPRDLKKQYSRLGEVSKHGKTEEATEH